MIINYKWQTPDSNDLDITIGYKLKWLGLEYEAHLAGYNLLDNSGYDYYYLKNAICRHHSQLSIKKKRPRSRF